jgi:hypothetical protein
VPQNEFANSFLVTVFAKPKSAKYKYPENVNQIFLTIFIEEDVFWLKISVKNILGMEVAQSNGNLGGKEPRLFLWEPSDLYQMPE